MPYERENYICTSEDRIHYDTEDRIPFGFYYIEDFQKLNIYYSQQRINNTYDRYHASTRMYY